MSKKYCVSFKVLTHITICVIFIITHWQQNLKILLLFLIFILGKSLFPIPIISWCKTCLFFETFTKMADLMKSHTFSNIADRLICIF